MWHVYVQKDILKGTWDKERRMRPYWEHFYVLAISGPRTYVHFYNFEDDYDKAQHLVERIRKDKDFSPENKPGVWFPIVDRRPRDASFNPWRKRYTRIGDFVR